MHWEVKRTDYSENLGVVELQVSWHAWCKAVKVEKQLQCTRMGCCWVVEVLWLLGELCLGSWMGWVGTVDQNKGTCTDFGWWPRENEWFGEGYSKMEVGCQSLAHAVWVAQEGLWLVVEQGGQWWARWCSRGMMEEALSPFSSWAHLWEL